MQLTIERTLSYFEVDIHFHATLAALFRNLQEAAILHAEMVGHGAEAADRDQMGWVLHKLAIRLRRYPRYKETIAITTWSTGVSGYLGLRDFEVKVAGEIIAQASSRWLFVDIARRSIRRVPAALVTAFAPERAEPLIPEVNAIERFVLDATDFTGTITTRYSDYDSNGHVNNAAYIDYLQTLSRQWIGDTHHADFLGICFVREINRGISEITGRLKREADRGLFNLCSGDTLHACGYAHLRPIDDSGD